MRFGIGLRGYDLFFAQILQMIKKLVGAIVACLWLLNVTAQTESKKGIAPFKIRLVNGEGFTYEQLKKDAPVTIIYFSPDCDHCKLFTKAMLKRIDQLKEQQIVMISYEHINTVKAFDKEFGLSSQKNIKIGSEGYTFVVQKYYNITRFPFVAKYNKQGRLTKMVTGDSAPEQIAAAL